MRRISLLLILGVILVWAGAAVAQQTDNLKGTYAFTGGGACLASFCGFNKADLTPKYCEEIYTGVSTPSPDGILGLAFSRSFSVQGVATFDGEGRGTVQGTEVDIVPPSSLNLWIEGASSERFRYEFTYKVADNGRITTRLVPGSFKGTFLTGRQAIYPALTFTIDKKTLSGRASEDFGVTKSLTLTTPAPEVVTVRFSNWDVLYKICHSSNVLIRIGDLVDD